ncbi:MAG: hypothetical protein IKC35_02535 [Clostridia bacterium]|nr:hypothetical protein [Clostridia bacterium]
MEGYVEFTREYEVRTTDCGLTANMSVEGAFCIVEDASSSLLSQIGMTGIMLNEKYGVTWVYTKHKMQIFKALPWLSKYKVRCYVSKISKVVSVFDIELYDEVGEIAVYSQLEMCLIELSSGRICPLSNVGFDKIVTKQSSFQSKFTRFSQVDSKVSYVTKVKTSNIDCNNHTNNTEYVRILLDSFTLDELRSNKIIGVEVNYINQSRYGDELSVLRYSEGNIARVDIKRGDTYIVKSQISFDF